MKSVPAVLEDAIEDGERAKLPMHVAILQLFANCPGCFGWTGGLEANDFDQIWDAAEVIFIVAFGGEALDVDGDGGVGLFLFRISIPR